MTDLDKKGIVFDIQSFSTHDGPGIRTNIFLKGCPLKCLWCANPEGQSFKPELFYKKEKCKGCFRCGTACTKGAITLNESEDIEKRGFIKIDRKICASCKTMECEKACYEDAMALMGKEMTVSEVMRAVLRDQPFYRNGGGATLSGGDPLCQPEFALAILKECKNNYVNVAMETELAVPFKVVEEVFPYVDLFLCDIKIVDEQKHIEATGMSNKMILDNLSKMAAMDASKICIRVPVIPGFSGTEENMHDIGKFCKENRLMRINLLPYHKLGESKFEKLGLKYEMPEVATPKHDFMLSMGKIIESYGITCIVN